MKKNIVSVALAVCMIGTTVPVAAADFSDVPAVENNSEFSDGNATDTCDSYTDVNLNFVYSENGETKSVDGELYPIKVPNKYVSGTYVTVPKAVLLEQLTAEGFSIPEGFEWNDDVISFDISDLPFGDMLEVELDKKQTVSLNYYDESAEAQIAEVPVLLSSKVTSVDLGEVNAHMPSGYVYAGSKNSLPIKDGYVYIPIKKEAKEVKINFYSEDEEKQIDESTIEVDKDATYVNTSAFANLVPSGYELVESGNLQIRDGYVYAAVRKAVTTKEVKINFYSEDEEKQIDEPTVEVDKDATYVNTSAFANLVPSGYELVESGNLQIRDGYVYAAVRKVATTKKEVKINFYSEKEKKQIDEPTIEVDKDATYVNASDLAKLVPSGYKLVLAGDLEIRDGYVYAAVEKVAVVKYKKVKLNFYNEKEETQVKEVTIKVKKTAKSVTVKEIQKSLPKNYTMTTTKTKLPIRDGYVYVAVTKKATAKTPKVKLNFYDEANKRQAAEVTIKVKKGAKSVTLTEAKKYLPEGYELDTTTEKLPIRDGYVYIAVRKVATTQTVKINYYCADEGKQIAEVDMEVAADATSVNTGNLTAPEGYEIAEVGDLPIRGGYVYVLVRKAVTTQTVKINYYCADEGKQIAEVDMEVAADATSVNTGNLTAPEGYEIAEVGDLPIRGGYVYVLVRKAVTTQTVKINYYCADEGKQIAEVDMEVAADATSVNTGNLTAPEGYEIAEVGDLPIRGGYVYVVVRKA